jgi:arylsulfatase A-like enzyme
MTNSMDTVIGRILNKIEGLDPNTYVIYISDNGTPMYNSTPTNLGYQIGNMYITRAGRGKGTAYESGARVAMVIKGPGIEAGQSSEFVHVADLFSTILELAGLTPPVDVPDGTGGTGTVPIDAVSLAPILFDGAVTVRDSDDCILTDAENIMFGNPASGKWAAARNRKYKVVCKDGTGTGNCEFFDLEIDPLEEHPLDQYETTNCDGLDTNDPRWHYCHLIDVIESQSTILWP